MLNVERSAGGILPGRGGGVQPHADAIGAAALPDGHRGSGLLVSSGRAGERCRHHLPLQMLLLVK